MRRCLVLGAALVVVLFLLSAAPAPASASIQGSWSYDLPVRIYWNGTEIWGDWAVRYAAYALYENGTWVELANDGISSYPDYEGFAVHVPSAAEVREVRVYVYALLGPILPYGSVSQLPSIRWLRRDCPGCNISSYSREDLDRYAREGWYGKSWRDLLPMFNKPVWIPRAGGVGHAVVRGPLRYGDEAVIRLHKLELPVDWRDPDRFHEYAVFLDADWERFSPPSSEKELIERVGVFFTIPEAAMVRSADLTVAGALVSWVGGHSPLAGPMELIPVVPDRFHLVPSVAIRNHTIHVMFKFPYNPPIIDIKKTPPIDVIGINFAGDVVRREGENPYLMAVDIDNTYWDGTPDTDRLGFSHAFSLVVVPWPREPRLSYEFVYENGTPVFRAYVVDDNGRWSWPYGPLPMRDGELLMGEDDGAYAGLQLRHTPFWARNIFFPYGHTGLYVEGNPPFGTWAFVYVSETRDYNFSAGMDAFSDCYGNASRLRLPLPGEATDFPENWTIMDAVRLINSPGNMGMGPRPRVIRWGRGILDVDLIASTTSFTRRVKVLELRGNATIDRYRWGYNRYGNRVVDPGAGNYALVFVTRPRPQDVLSLFNYRGFRFLFLPPHGARRGEIYFQLFYYIRPGDGYYFRFRNTFGDQPPLHPDAPPAPGNVTGERATGILRAITSVIREPETSIPILSALAALAVNVALRRRAS